MLDSAQPLILPLSDAHTELAHVGEHYRFLAHLASRQLPVAPLYLVTPLFLARLAEHNELGEVLKKFLPAGSSRTLRAEEVASHQIREHLTQFHYSSELGQAFLTAYVQWWEGQSVDLSWLDPHQRQTRPRLAEQLVAGESNISLSLLNVWSEWYQPLALKHRLAELKDSRFTYPLIIVRPRLAAKVSGEAFTLHPELKHKGRVLIKAHWGEVPPADQTVATDLVEVDVRTFHIVHREQSVKAEEFLIKNHQLVNKAVPTTRQNQACLTDEQLSELARLCYQIKQLTVHHVQVKWQLGKNGLEITDVNQVQDQEELHPQPTNSTRPQPTLALGQILIKGYVTNQAQVLTTPRDIAAFAPGKIAIIPELTAEWLPLLHKTSAVICEGGVQSAALLQTLKEYHVPTLIQVSHALKLFQKTAYLTVNALKGSVHLATPTDVRQAQTQPKSHLAHQPNNLKSTQPEPHHTLPTITKVLVTATSTNQLAELSKSGIDGVGLLKSEYVMSQLGSHPLHVLKTSQADQLKQALVQLIHTYAPQAGNYPMVYRSQNFNSGELLQLNNSTPYEQPEPNPFLGFRGGIRLLHTRTLIEFELEVLYEASQRLHRAVPLLLPFVRTAAEFQLLQRQISEYYQRQHPDFNLPVWVQINTPANLAHIRHLLALNVAGLTLNTRTLFALWYGVDPDNPDVYALYPFDSELIRQALKEVHRAVTEYHQATGRHVPILLHLEDGRNELITLAAELNLAGVIIKPNFAKTAKQLIIEVQHAQLHLE